MQLLTLSPARGQAGPGQHLHSHSRSVCFLVVLSPAPSSYLH